MIWGDSGYTSSPNIDSLLSREDLSLTEILDDEDIIQECKSQNKKLIAYLTQPNIRDELVAIITTEPASELADIIRFKHPNVACEILTSDVPPLYSCLVADDKTLSKLYDFLKQDPPLNPLLSSYFSRTFSSMILRKPEQNWFSYKCICHEVLEFIKTKDDFFDSILKHIDMPVIMDLLFQIITQIKESEIKKSLLDHVTEVKLLEKLIEILKLSHETEKHNNIAQFLSELIRTSRTMRQDERQVDATLEATDPILEALEGEHFSKLLLETILGENNSESSIIAGIKIILTLFENHIVNAPASDTALQYLINSEFEHHKTVVLGLINTIVPTVNAFQNILLNPPVKLDATDMISETFPFGNTRLQVCCLFTVLIETENNDILNAICEIDFFNILLKLFKEYCWNNFLHNQVKKCLVFAFRKFDEQSDTTPTVLIPSALQKHIIDKCKLISKLLDCWTHNDMMQAPQGTGRRLGYMGHLIEIFDQLVSNISKSDELRALVESSLTEVELELWKQIIAADNGDLVKILEVQRKYLANHIPNSQNNACYDASPSKDYMNDQYNDDYFHDVDTNLHNVVEDFGELENQQKLFEQACKKPFQIGSYDWDDNDTYDNDEQALKNINERMKAWSKDLECSDPLDGEEATSVEFGTVIGDDPWKITDNDPISLNFVNPWSSELKQSQQAQIQSSIITDNWANFDSNNFADFDTHFTDFEPISGSMGNLKANTATNREMSPPEFSEINIDDLKLNKLTITKNLIPGADGRLVLATNVIPFDNKSDNNANIHTTDTYRDETELDNLRIPNEITEETHKPVPLKDETITDINYRNDDYTTNGIIGEPITNGPKSQENETLSTGSSSVFETDIKELKANVPTPPVDSTPAAPPPQNVI